MRLLEYLYYFFCFCPFIIPMPGMHTDIQPYAFIVAVIYIILNNKELIRPNKVLMLLGAFVLYSMLIGLAFSDNWGDLTKSLYSYASLFIVSYAGYNIMDKRGSDETTMKTLILIWFGVGLIQFIVYPSFLTQIVSGARTTTDRGVFSLASEPSFYGIQCFYFLLASTTFKTSKNVFMGLICTMAIFFAQSFMGMIFIFGFLVPYLIQVMKLKVVFYALLVLILILGLATSDFVINNIQGSRLYYLLQLFSENGPNSFLSDESASVRFYTIRDALVMFDQNSLMPTGFSKRIGSMIGGIFVELGVFALPLIFSIISSFAKFFTKNISQIVACVLFFILLFSTLQLSNPMISFVIALSLIKQDENNIQQANI